MQVSAQSDYFEYQNIFNRVDQDILKNDLVQANIRLDSIYNFYSFIYAKHCIKALQVCCSAKDNDRANKWLKKCFIQGVPLWLIRNNEITKSLLYNELAKSTINSYQSLRDVYNKSINLELAKIIDSLYYQIDQPHTRKLNDGFILLRPYYGIKWLANNKRQFKIIKDITQKYGFPGERLIGLPSYFQDSVLAFKNIQFYGPEIFDLRAYIMLIHYYSNPHKDINELLFENVKNGFLPSYQYAAINDFLARWGKNKYAQYVYYNVWHIDEDSSHISKINERRLAIGLNTYQEQEHIKSIKMECRKNRLMNSSILLE